MRHYGRTMNEVCLYRMGSGKRERCEIIGFDSLDNNRCRIRFLDGNLKGTEADAVCEWLDPVEIKG